jgi:oxygen-independent coproporphyrinogen III oxidase
VGRWGSDWDFAFAVFGARDRFAEEVESLAPLVDAGLARIEGEHIVMAAEGRAYVRIAAAAFDAHLAAGQKRHSLAI